MAIQFARQQGKPAKKSTAARKADVPRSPEVRPLPEGEGRREMRKQTEISDLVRGPSEISASPVDTKILGIDYGGHDYGAKVIGRVLPDGKIEILSIAHTPPSKAQFDKIEYQRSYMRDLRTIKRLNLNMTVKEWREKNAD